MIVHSRVQRGAAESCEGNAECARFDAKQNVLRWAIRRLETIF